MKKLCFIPRFCICGKEIILKTRNFAVYEKRGYPSRCFGHQNLGKKFSQEHKDKIRKSNKESKVVRFPNSGSFKKGHPAWNKKLKEIQKELLKPEISPENKQILLTEQEKCMAAIAKLEAMRLEKIAKQKQEPKPKEIPDINPAKRMIKCIKTDKIRIYCLSKGCEHYVFCHTFKHPKIKKVLKNYRTLSEIQEGE